MSTPEGRIKDKVKKRFAEEFPACYRFMPVQNGMGSPSLDFLYCVDGLFVGIETKAEPEPGSKWPEPTPRQKSTMAEIRSAGGTALLVYDAVTLDGAVEEIKAMLMLRRLGELP